MKLFLFSNAMNRFETDSILAALKAGYDPSEFEWCAVEALNVAIDDHGPEVWLHEKPVDPRRIDTVFLLDLGRISLATLSYRYYTLRHLEELGCRLINSPRCIMLCRNKLATYFCLQRAGLPIIPSLATSDGNLQPDWAREGRRLVKPLLGTQGLGIVEIPEAQGEADSLLREIIGQLDIPVIQPIVPKPANRDLRLLVVGDRVVAGMWRHGRPGALTTNIARGGTPERATITADMASLGVRSAQAVGGAVVTVDLVEDQSSGLKVLEVNGFARWQGLQKVWPCDIGSVIVEFAMKGRHSENCEELGGCAMD